MKICLHERNSLVREFGKTLEKVTYLEKTYDIRKLPELARRNKDTLYFVWAGLYRKLWQDKHPPTKNIAFIEHGFLPHYETITIDPVGHLANSSFASYALTEANEDELEAYLRTNYWLKYDHSGISSIRYPFVLFPIQHHQDCVIRYDATDYSRDYSNIIRDCLKALPKGHMLVVKQHPKGNQGFRTVTDHNVLYLDKIEDKYKNDCLNDYLLRQSIALVSINSSYIFEALVRNTPVISLGKGMFTGKGVTKEVDKIEPGIFENLTVDQKRNKMFMYELCLNRQVIPGQSPTRLLDRFWQERGRLLSND